MSPFATYPGNNAPKGAVVPIAKAILTSNGDVSFANIPTTYQDLMIVISGRTSISYTTSAGLYMGFNNTYGAGGYSSIELDGFGVSTSSSINANTNYFSNLGNMPSSIMPSNIFGNYVINILNYANTTTYKTLLYKGAYDMNNSGGVFVGAGTWRNTAAIVQMYITAAGTFVTGTTVTLYGVRSIGQ
jgi:hypothetical protein